MNEVINTLIERTLCALISKRVNVHLNGVLISSQQRQSIQIPTRMPLILISSALLFAELLLGRLLITFSIIYKYQIHFIAFIKNSFFIFYAFIKQQVAAAI